MGGNMAASNVKSLISGDVIDALIPVALQLAPIIGAVLLTELKKLIRNNVSLSKEEKAKFVTVLDQANIANPGVYLLSRNLPPDEAEKLYNELKQK